MNGRIILLIALLGLGFLNVSHANFGDPITELNYSNLPTVFPVDRPVNIYDPFGEPSAPSKGGIGMDGFNEGGEGEPTPPWIINGTSEYVENANGFIIVDPALAEADGNGIYTQHINYTNYITEDMVANFSLYFNQTIDTLNLSLWQNTTLIRDVPIYERLNSIEIWNATLVADMTYDWLDPMYNPYEHCTIGDSNNIYKYIVEYHYPDTESTESQLYCFDSYEFDEETGLTSFNISYNNIIGYTQENYTGEGWIDLSLDKTEYDTYNIYTWYDINLTQGIQYNFKLDYTTQEEIGKYSIDSYIGAPLDVVTGDATLFIELDPWWNGLWRYSQSIIIRNTWNTTLTNFTVPIKLDTTNSLYWNKITCTNVRFVGKSVV